MVQRELWRVLPKARGLKIMSASYLLWEPRGDREGTYGIMEGWD